VYGPGISIHVPARGTTTISTANLITKVFQSTFPRGERPPALAVLLDGSRISIHVPARGTTTGKYLNRQIHNNFNPRSREGNDPIDREGEAVGQNFNPRSREGNDFSSAFICP